MKLVTYTSYKEHFRVYAAIDNLISVKSCYIGFARKCIILLSDTAMIPYLSGLHPGVEDIHLKFTRSVGTYFVDDH